MRPSYWHVQQRAAATITSARTVPPVSPAQRGRTALKAAVLTAVREIGDRLREAGIRVRIDDRTDTPFG
ncbi:hypothetical protein AB0915_32660, partial [Streptomyces sp. NPDC048411]